MESFWLDLGLSILFSTLRVVVKNPTHKESVRRQLVKLRDQLLIAYPIEEV